jgi:NAD(P)-dependent dehydrogenase (short-subunit alcohol dehydrogenase family)
VHERELKSLYPETEVMARKFDAADEAAMKAVVEEAVSKYGRLDVMFANAGVSGSLRDFRDVEADEVLGVLRTNVVR